MLRRRCLVAGLLLAWGVVAQGANADTVSDLLQRSLQPRLQVQSNTKVDEQQLWHAVAEFYAAEHWAPVWDDARFAALLHELADMAGDGLDPEDYSLSTLEEYKDPGSNPQRLAEREQLATHAYLLALIHLYHGKVDPLQLDAHWNFDMRPVDIKTGLDLARDAVDSNDIPGIFQRARPSLPQYAILQRELTHLRAIAHDGGWPEIPGGPIVKPNTHDTRIPLLRRRLAIEGWLGGAANDSSDKLDPDLSAALKTYQHASVLDADGRLGADTTLQLNITVQQRIDQVRANLERMRWLLGQLDEDAVLVDIAGYHVFYIHDNKMVWESRIQIGKAYRQTPEFKSYITRVTLNPGWTVPPTIMAQDALPAIRRDPNYFNEHHMHVFDATGQELSPASVNWQNPGNITLRQDPGPDNSLGQLVLRFPNNYSVYMHDTPHQELFNSRQRAFSSGCLRVEDIRELAVLLLNDNAHWSRAQLDAALTEYKTRDVPLPHKVPVLLAYWTVDFGDNSAVSFKPDIYGQDPKLIQALDDHSGVSAGLGL